MSGVNAERRCPDNLMRLTKSPQQEERNSGLLNNYQA
jgi:hypothetical protein